MAGVTKMPGPTATVTELPSPPPGKTGWPWTEESEQLPETMPDGTLWTKISVVTPSYNQGQFLEETIRSVLLQGYRDLEYIVIDGGSSDDSVAIIKKYAPWLAYWVSEPDRGQTEAINKGLKQATGQIFNWINSDDLLLPGALRMVAARFGGQDAVAGPVVNFGVDGAEEVIPNWRLKPTAMIRGEAEVSFHQPGLWLRRESVLDCGGIDENLHYAFDWDLAIRYLSLFPRIAYVSSPLARFRLHDGSKTIKEPERFHKERVCILRKLLSDGRFQSLRQLCDRRLRRIEWWEMLNELMDGGEAPRFVRAARIFVAAWADPTVRWTRLTLGAIRQTVLNGIN